MKRGGKKKKSTTALGVMYADFFFSLTHPPLDRHRGDRRNKRGYVCIPRLFHCHSIFFLFEEQKE